MSDDAGENWNTVPLDPADGNGRGLSVLSDGRLMVTMYLDLPATRLLVSSSAVGLVATGSGPELFSEILASVRSRVEVYQDGTVLHYELGATDGSDAHLDFPVKFSTDLNDLVDHPRTHLVAADVDARPEPLAVASTDSASILLGSLWSSRHDVQVFVPTEAT